MAKINKANDFVEAQLLLNQEAEKKQALEAVTTGLAKSFAKQDKEKACCGGVGAAMCGVLDTASLGATVIQCCPGAFGMPKAAADQMNLYADALGTMSFLLEKFEGKASAGNRRFPLMANVGCNLKKQTLRREDVDAERAKQPACNMKANKAFWAEMKRANGFIDATYPESNITAANDDDDLCKLLGITKENIIVNQRRDGTSTTKGADGMVDPEFYIVKIPEKKEVWVGIRGTASLKNAMSDVLVSPVEFLGGQGHLGFVRQTLSLLKHYNQQLVDLSDKSYTLNICGHSLGASSSISFGGMVAKSGIHLNYKKMKIWALEPAPCYKGKFFDDVIRTGNVELYSFIHKNDIITNLTLSNIMNVAVQSRVIDRTNLSPNSFWFKVAKDELDLRYNYTFDENSTVEVPDAKAIADKEFATELAAFPNLEHQGETYHILPGKVIKLEGQQKNFQRFPFQPDMVTSHFRGEVKITLYPLIDAAVGGLPQGPSNSTVASTQV